MFWGKVTKVTEAATVAGNRSISYLEQPKPKQMKRAMGEDHMSDIAGSELATKTCVPCRGGIPPLAGEQLKALSKQIPEWAVSREHDISRTFSFPYFRSALDFVNQVGELAEREGHHPDIVLKWGSVGITIWTHKINGLTESDFILAAKIDRLKR